MVCVKTKKLKACLFCNHGTPRDLSVWGVDELYTLEKSTHYKKLFTQLHGHGSDREEIEDKAMCANIRDLFKNLRKESESTHVGGEYSHCPLLQTKSRLPSAVYTPIDGGYTILTLSNSSSRSTPTGKHTQ
jgi:hypothetical protein